MVVREASKRLETVPAVFETTTERVKVSDATREWKKGSRWVSRAVNVRPASGFTVGADGKVDGAESWHDYHQHKLRHDPRWDDRRAKRIDRV